MTLLDHLVPAFSGEAYGDRGLLDDLPFGVWVVGLVVLGYVIVPGVFIGGIFGLVKIAIRATPKGKV